MNPIERPPYVRRPHERGVAVEVEAPDWRGLLAAAALGLSDVIRPLGRFGTWTARRISAKAPGREAVMAHWLARVLLDHRETGFSTALVEVEKAEEGRAAGILRGGCIDPADDPPAFDASDVPAEEVEVHPGPEGQAWKARFVVAGCEPGRGTAAKA